MGTASTRCSSKWPLTQWLNEKKRHWLTSSHSMQILHCCLSDTRWTYISMVIACQRRTAAFPVNTQLGRGAWRRQQRTNGRALTECCILRRYNYQTVNALRTDADDANWIILIRVASSPCYRPLYSVPALRAPSTSYMVAKNQLLPNSQQTALKAVCVARFSVQLECKRSVTMFCLFWH